VKTKRALAKRQRPQPRDVARLKERDPEAFDLLLATNLASRDLDRRPRASRDRVALGLDDVATRLAQDREVRPLLARLKRAATGRDAATSARLQLAFAVSLVAAHEDETWASMLVASPHRTEAALDDLLCRLVCSYLVGPTAHLPRVASKLERHPAAVARAVRASRKPRGRPKNGSPRMPTRWRALADLERIAGLGARSEEAVEQSWKDHGPKP
jgi:hypothetical protein